MALRLPPPGAFLTRSLQYAIELLLRSNTRGSKESPLFPQKSRDETREFEQHFDAIFDEGPPHPSQIFQQAGGRQKPRNECIARREQFCRQEKPPLQNASEIETCAFQR